MSKQITHSELKPRAVIYIWYGTSAELEAQAEGGSSGGTVSFIFGFERCGNSVMPCKIGNIIIHLDWCQSVSINYLLIERQL